jgi:hypothetical protein
VKKASLEPKSVGALWVRREGARSERPKLRKLLVYAPDLKSGRLNFPKLDSGQARTRIESGCRIVFPNSDS